MAFGTEPMMHERTPSRAAERMRRSRERRRNGLRHFGVELHETEINSLVRKGFLTEAGRHDDGDVIIALYSFLDHCLA